MKRIIVSDVHLSSASALTGDGRQAWAWTTAVQTAAFARFLRSDAVTSADKLILAGDIVDAWICPIDLRPPTLGEIILEPHNVDVLEALLLYPGEIVLLPGNHDMALTHETARAIRADVVFGSHYDEGVLSVRHGHECSLFNAPDPVGRAVPIGYWLSRFSATGVANGGTTPGTDLWSILVSGARVIGKLAIQSFAECVFDETLRQTGVAQGDRVIAPWGSSMAISDLRAMYENLMAEWDASRVGSRRDLPSSEEAVLAEWDPYYGVPVGTRRLHVWGHSHQQLMARHESYGVYLNAGSWCGPNGPCFVEVTGAPFELAARAYAWDSSAEHATSLTDEITL